MKARCSLSLSNVPFGGPKTRACRVRCRALNAQGKIGTVIVSVAAVREEFPKEYEWTHFRDHASEGSTSQCLACGGEGEVAGEECVKCGGLAASYVSDISDNLYPSEEESASREDDLFSKLLDFARSCVPRELTSEEDSFVADLQAVVNRKKRREKMMLMLILNALPQKTENDDLASILIDTYEDDPKRARDAIRTARSRLFGSLRAVLQRYRVPVPEWLRRDEGMAAIRSHRTKEKAT